MSHIPESSNLSEELRQQVASVRIQIEGRTSVSIEDFRNGELLVYGLALQDNTKVTHLELLFDAHYNHNANDANEEEFLITFIEKSATLKQVACVDIRSEALVRIFLQAAAANLNIENFELDTIPALAAMMELVIKESKSVKKLLIVGGGIVWTNGYEEVESISADWTNGDEDIGLAYALRQNESLECLYLKYWNFQQPHFHLLAKAIKQSTSVKSMVFDRCHFYHSSATDLLELVCREESNIHELKVVNDCKFENEDQASFLVKVIQTRAPTAILTALHVNLYRFNIEDLLRPFQQYTNSSNPLWKCIRFNIDDVLVFEKLVSTLPTLQGLDEAEFFVTPEFTSINEDAMKRNCCLKSLQVVDITEGWILVSDTLTKLGSRNEMIHCWRHEPQPLPKEYMYRALATCLDYTFQHEIIFDLLKKHWVLLDNKSIVRNV